jgi:hypothetical protein
MFYSYIVELQNCCLSITAKWLTKITLSLVIPIIGALIGGLLGWLYVFIFCDSMGKTFKRDLPVTYAVFTIFGAWIGGIVTTFIIPYFLGYVAAVFPGSVHLYIILRCIIVPSFQNRNGESRRDYGRYQPKTPNSNSSTRDATRSSTSAPSTPTTTLTKPTD